jgi:hypothetical protein
MAQNQPILCPQAEWTKLTNALVTSDISIALIDGSAEIMATSGVTPPTVTEGMPLLSKGDGWSEATIFEKFPGVPAADTLWARPIHTPSSARIFISHG